MTIILFLYMFSICSATRKSFESIYADEECALFNDRKDAPKKDRFNEIKHIWYSPQVRSLNITVNKEDWDTLRSNVLEKEYIDATLDLESLEGEDGPYQWENVKWRFRGDTSLRTCQYLAPYGCNKMKSKLKFPKDDTFFGVRKLAINQGSFGLNAYDPFMVKQHLSMSIYRQLGIPAPHDTYVNIRYVIKNGDDMTEIYGGLHILTEVVDTYFIKTYFDDDDGNLYKDEWFGVTNETAIRTSLRTNEEDGDISRFVAFGRALSTSTTDRSLKRAVRKYTDVDEMVTFYAVERFINNLDGPNTYYMNISTGEFASHNVYIYETPDGKFHPIPWDMDLAFPDGPPGVQEHTLPWDVPVCNDPSVCTSCEPIEVDIGPGISGYKYYPQCVGLTRTFSTTFNGKMKKAIKAILKGPGKKEHLYDHIDNLVLLSGEYQQKDSHPMVDLYPCDFFTNVQPVPVNEESVHRIKVVVSYLVDTITATLYTCDENARQWENYKQEYRQVDFDSHNQRGKLPILNTQTIEIGANYLCSDTCYPLYPIGAGIGQTDCAYCGYCFDYTYLPFNFTNSLEKCPGRFHLPGPYDIPETRY